MKLKTFILLISFAFFQVTNLKALLIYQPGGYADQIQSFMNEISQTERFLSAGNKTEAAKALSSAEVTFKNIKESAQNDIKNYTLLRAYLSAYDFYPKDKIYEANKDEVAKFLKKSLESIEAKVKQLDRSIKAKESFKSTGDKAYDDYFKNCQERIKQFPKELLDMPVGIPQVIGSYECVTHEQWKKNNEELAEAVAIRDEKKVKELLEVGGVNVNYRFDKDLLFKGIARIYHFENLTPLILATLPTYIYKQIERKRNNNIIKMLLQHGANANLESKDYGSAVYNYIGKGNIVELDPSIVKDMVEIVDIKNPKTWEIVFALLYLISPERPQYFEYVKRLISRGFDINQPILWGYSADPVNKLNFLGYELRMMDEHNYDQKNSVITFLLENGANPTVKDNYGLSAFDHLKQVTGLSGSQRLGLKALMEKYIKK